MKIEFRTEPLAQLSVSALAVYCFEESPCSSGTVERLPEEARHQLQELQTAGELTGKAFEFTTSVGLRDGRREDAGGGSRQARKIQPDAPPPFGGRCGEESAHPRGEGTRVGPRLPGAWLRFHRSRRGRLPLIMMRTATGRSATRRRELTDSTWRRGRGRCPLTRKPP